MGEEVGGFVIYTPLVSDCYLTVHDDGLKSSFHSHIFDLENPMWLFLGHGDNDRQALGEKDDFFAFSLATRRLSAKWRKDRQVPFFVNIHSQPRCQQDLQ